MKLLLVSMKNNCHEMRSDEERSSDTDNIDSYSENNSCDGNDEECSSDPDNIDSNSGNNSCDGNDEGCSSDTDNIDSNSGNNSCEEMGSPEECSSDDNTEMDNMNDPKKRLRYLLRNWDAENPCPRKAGNDLLKILQDYKKDEKLPKDWQTIKVLPKKLKNFLNHESKEKCGGWYQYLGIKKNLSLMHELISSCIENTILLAFNTDGVQLTESSTNEFWPIYGKIQSGKPFLIALWYGHSKPNDFNEFFQDFVEEAICLEDNGICIRKKQYKFEIHFFSADTPAKAYSLMVKAPAGYWSCTKCRVKGQRIIRIIKKAKVGNRNKKGKLKNKLIKKGQKNKKLKDKVIRSNIHFISLNEESRSTSDYYNVANAVSYTHLTLPTIYSV